MIALIRKSNNAKELIHNISLAEVKEQGRIDRFKAEHRQVKLKRKRIGNEEKAKQRKEDKEMRSRWGNSMDDIQGVNNDSDWW